MALKEQDNHETDKRINRDGTLGVYGYAKLSTAARLTMGRTKYWIDTTGICITRQCDTDAGIPGQRQTNYTDVFTVR